jgi:hypothetical protein
MLWCSGNISPEFAGNRKIAVSILRSLVALVIDRERGKGGEVWGREGRCRVVREAPREWGRREIVAPFPAWEVETVGEERADRWAPVVGLAGGLHPSVEEKKNVG